MSTRESIEAAARKIDSLIAYTEKTGVRTTHTQSFILGKFSLEEQAQIVELLSVNVPAALTGGGQ
jgi:hypothetical protein